MAAIAYCSNNRENVGKSFMWYLSIQWYGEILLAIPTSLPVLPTTLTLMANPVQRWKDTINMESE